MTNQINYFAAKAMQGYLSGDYDQTHDEIVERSFELASKMLISSCKYSHIPNLEKVDELLLHSQNAVEALNDYLALMSSIKMEKEEMSDVDYVMTSLAEAIHQIKKG